MTLTVISLGAGVQSTTMLLMANAGELEPRPDVAVFADTQWEPKAVYDHLAWLETISEIPIHRVSAGNLRTQLLAGVGLTSTKAFVSIPLHLRNEDGSKGFIRRQCTNEHKIKPIERHVRKLLGIKWGERLAAGAVDQWLGITTDEATRMRDSRHKWQTLRYPLIDRRMSRLDCKSWLTAHGYPIPTKSACIGCPFHSNHEWREIRKKPAEWADVLEVDRAIRVQRRLKAEAFLHRDLVPLEGADLRTAEDHGQLNLFENECEGVCGV